MEGQIVAVAQETKTFDMSGRHLPVVPSSFIAAIKAKDISLEAIDLSYNCLSSLSKDLDNEMFREAESLDVSHNSVSSVDKDGMEGLVEHLKKLNLSYNALTCSAFVSCCCFKSLTELNVSHNPLHNLPDELADFSELKTLILDDCGLYTLPKSFYSVHSLEVLSLSDNRISKLPGDISKLDNLKSLDLRNNNLVKLPAELADLKSLSKLLLSGNPLRAPSVDVCTLPADEIKSRISELAESAAYAPFCRFVDVRDPCFCGGDKAETEFYLETYNDKGIPCIKGDAKVTVVARSPSGKEVKSDEIKDENNGRYLVKFVFEVPGRYEIIATVNGTEVSSRPPKIKTRFSSPKSAKEDEEEFVLEPPCDYPEHITHVSELQKIAQSCNVLTHSSRVILYGENGYENLLPGLYGVDVGNYETEGIRRPFVLNFVPPASPGKYQIELRPDPICGDKVTGGSKTTQIPDPSKLKDYIKERNEFASDVPIVLQISTETFVPTTVVVCPRSASSSSEEEKEQCQNIASELLSDSSALNILALRAETWEHLSTNSLLSAASIFDPLLTRTLVVLTDTCLLAKEVFDDPQELPAWAASVPSRLTVFFIPESGRDTSEKKNIKLADAARLPEERRNFVGISALRKNIAQRSYAFHVAQRSPVLLQLHTALSEANASTARLNSALATINSAKLPLSLRRLLAESAAYLSSAVRKVLQGTVEPALSGISGAKASETIAGYLVRHPAVRPVVINALQEQESEDLCLYGGAEIVRALRMFEKYAEAAEKGEEEELKRQMSLGAQLELDNSGARKVGTLVAENALEFLEEVTLEAVKRVGEAAGEETRRKESEMLDSVGLGSLELEDNAGGRRAEELFAEAAEEGVRERFGGWKKALAQPVVGYGPGCGDETVEKIIEATVKEAVKMVSGQYVEAVVGILTENVPKKMQLEIAGMGEKDLRTLFGASVVKKAVENDKKAAEAKKDQIQQNINSVSAIVF